MKIAVIQICSGYEPRKNLEKINRYIKEAKNQSEIEAVFLPEVFYSMSDGTKATEHLIEGENEHFQAIAKIASENQVMLIGGSCATRENGKIFNRSYNFDKNGKLLSTYDKIHLFRVDLTSTKNATVIDESSVYASGKNPQLLEVGEWKIGIGICFDVRFPELFRNYFVNGANLMSICAAFTRPTGIAHWETLLRARAIENQSYVVASAQFGDHNERIKTYGHSLVIDPWGKVIADCGEKEGLVVCDLSLEEIHSVRSRMNVLPQIT